ncbi:MAG: MaoC family dehydratase N-terminal domain-containing protein [Rhodospirillaceae bacterium]|jgi:3-methylfumaryl-CoA hydratase
MSDTPEIDIDHLNKWKGKSEERESRVEATPIALFNATLDYEKPFPKDGDVIPPICYRQLFPPLARQSLIKEDGHIQLGDFFPPVPLPRRMNGGSRLSFLKPLHVGEKVRRVNSVGDVTYKEGRSGPLVFVKFISEVFGEDGLAVIDDQDIIYREAADPNKKETKPSKPKEIKKPGEAVWRRTITPTPTLLFRYSALIFNAHRIHYDYPYVTGVEGYPGLIFHGPLTAVVLLDLFHRENPEKNVTQFNYRADAPLFADNPFDVCGEPSSDGKTAKVWTENHKGNPTMTGTVEAS